MAVFVDTGTWYAACVNKDSDHEAASEFLRNNSEPLVSTDHVFAELLTLFRKRGEMRRAQEWVDEVRAGHCTIVRATDADLAEATRVFFDFRDKEWSYCDCLSRVVIERLQLSKAFAFDEHFRQYGTVQIVP